MKKQKVVGVILGAFFLFLLSGCSENENSQKSNSNSETAAVEKDKKKESTWKDYSNEQKEKKVKEKLVDKKLDHYPVSPIIEEVDHLYQNTDYTMSEFDRALDESINKLEQLKVVEVVERYGNDYFTAEDQLQNLEIYHVYEKNNKVFVLYKTSSSSDKLYLSVAEDGVWVKKDVPIRSFNVDLDKRLSNLKSPTKHYPFSTRYYGDHIYTFFRSNVIGSPIILADSEFDETGVVSEKIILEGSGDDVYLAKTDTDSPAFLYAKKTGNDRSLKVYVNNDFSKPKYDVPIQSKYYASVIHGNTNDLYINLTSGILIYGDQDTSQLDLNSGEPIWDESGQEKVWDLKYDANTIEHYVSDLMTLTNPQTNTIAKYNANLQLVGEELPIPLKLDFDEAWDFHGYKQTNTQDEIHIWQPITYKNKLHLQQVRIAKGIDSGSTGSGEMKDTASTPNSTSNNESSPADFAPKKEDMAMVKKLAGEWETSIQDVYTLEFKEDGTTYYHFQDRNEVSKGKFKINGKNLTFINPDKTSEHEIVQVDEDQLQLYSKETKKLIIWTKVKSE